MLDGVEPDVVAELRHAAAQGVKRVETVRARWLGHRLYGEINLALDPALSIADAHKVAVEIRKHARHHLPALESLNVQVVPALEGERSQQRPQAEPEHHH